MVYLLDFPLDDRYCWPFAHLPKKFVLPCHVFNEMINWYCLYHCIGMLSLCARIATWPSCRMNLVSVNSIIHLVAWFWGSIITTRNRDYKCHVSFEIHLLPCILNKICGLWYFWSWEGQFQDLTSQVSSESDPVKLLPKVVALLYMQVRGLSIFSFFSIRHDCDT